MTGGEDIVPTRSAEVRILQPDRVKELEGGHELFQKKVKKEAGQWTGHGHEIYGERSTTELSSSSDWFGLESQFAKVQNRVFLSPIRSNYQLHR